MAEFDPEKTGRLIGFLAAMQDHPLPCLLCGDPVVAGEDRTKWGMGWTPGAMVHYRCADALAEASCRVRFIPQRVDLIDHIKTMAQDVKRLVSDVSILCPPGEIVKRWVVEAGVRATAYLDVLKEEHP